MKRYSGTCRLAWIAAMVCTTAHADGTVGLNPSDGVNMFVKAFSVAAGTVITGAEFVNNDAATVFPAVLLVRGGSASLAEGTTERTATNATETSGGVVSVTWSTPVEVSDGGTYYVAVQPPEGPGKQGDGHGPAIGATRVDTPVGSFLSAGTEGELVPLGVDLGITLRISSGSFGKAQAPAPVVARTFLGDPRPNPFNPTTEIDFGVARSANVQLAIYDARGRAVRWLVRETRQAGEYREMWDGQDNSGQPSAAGVYFVRLAVGSELLQKKLVLAK